ncbi:uridine/cytidine kinase [Ranunculus cassubicifolius]
MSLNKKKHLALQYGEDFRIIRSSFGSFLEQTLTEVIATGVHVYPFLHARAPLAVAKFSFRVNPRILEKFMYVVKAIGLNVC